MNDKLYTGNTLLDKLTRGSNVPNPNYNPKTKAGRSQPQFLVNTSAGDPFGGAVSDASRRIADIDITGKDLGFNNDEIEELNNDGYVLSNAINKDSLNKAYAENQSAAAQFGNFLMQAGIGEVVLGTLEGFGNIVDGVINSFTGDAYGMNPYTEFMHKAKEDFNNNFKIYQENPEAAFQLGDFGWWTQNAVSVFSTASLMLPAMGWARGLSTVGKLGAVRGATRLASKGIAKGASALAKGTKFSALNNLAKAGRIEQSIYDGSKILTQATLSRAGENFMEARETYDTVYADIKENLDNMPDKEYAKFINNNPEFKDISKDDVAKEIAKQSANKTFYNDWWMLLMDIPQFKALGSLWGTGSKAAKTAGQRIAAENVKRTMAGQTDKLIENNIANRIKYHYKNLLKNPKELLTSLELTEGFEELYQGIQSEKGLEVAEKYFNPNFAPRTISNYLSDGHIWEQFVWGAIGGIAFGQIGKGVNKARRTAEGLWNKKHMTAEEYEQWKTSDDQIAIKQINDITNKTTRFVENMKKINSNINPYNYIVDPTTGRIVIKDGEMVEEHIDDVQKELLKQQTLDQFVVDTALDAIDRGNIDLITDIVSSPAFDKYIADEGYQLSKDDKAISQQVVDRMNEIKGIYQNELRDVNALADTTNPHITIAAARDITRNRLLNEDYNRQLDNINIRLAEVSNDNDYDIYRDRTAYSIVRKNINNLRKKKQKFQEDYEHGTISKTAYEQYSKEIDNDITQLLNYLTNNTTKGLLDNIKESLAKESLDDTLTAFDKFANDYEAAVFENAEELPPDSVVDLYKQQIDIETKKAYTTAKLPVNKEDYQNIYNEYAVAMDAYYQEKVNDWMDTIKKYLSKQERTDEAIKKIINGKTGNKKVDEAANALRFGYFNNNNQISYFTEFKNYNALNKIFDDFIKGEKEAEERVKAAKEVGLELPGAAEESNNEETKKDTNKNMIDVKPPSTGGVTESKVVPINPTNTSNDKNDSINDDNSKLGKTDKSLNNSPIIEGQPIDKPFDEQLTDKQKFEYEQQAQLDATKEAVANAEASKYVMQVGYKQRGKLDDITEAFSKKDYSKYNSFIEEITNFLINRGTDKNIAEPIAKKAFKETVDAFGALNNKSTFGKLAQQLANGFSEEDAKKYSITELISDENSDTLLDNVIDNFLNEYIKLVKDNQLNDGRYVINLKSLFEYILDTDDIDINTAAHIYQNMGIYISKQDSSKYIFTGVAFGEMLSAKQFFDRINEDKIEKLESGNNLHISPIEADQRTPEYTEALLAAANGKGKTTIVAEGTKREFDNVALDDNKKTIPTYLSVYVTYPKGKKTNKVKVGILRTVYPNHSLTGYAPVSHVSGFSNIVEKFDDGTINLDCDFLFNALINANENNDTEAKSLFNDLIDYIVTIQDTTNRFNAGIINDEQLKKELAEAMSLDTANHILNNTYIKKLLEESRYKFRLTVEQTNKSSDSQTIIKAKKLSESIASILFYGHAFDSSNTMNRDVNTMSLNTKDMTSRYNDWKNKIYNNYGETYTIQEELKDGTYQVNTKLNVSYHTYLNTIEKGEQMLNIEDAGFDIDETSPTYTPLVMINNNRIIDENNHTYGAPESDIGNYSMGFLVYHKVNNNVAISHVAYCNTALPLDQDGIVKNLKDELHKLINDQINNIDPKTHADNFYRIRDSIDELFGFSSLFKFKDININIDKAKNSVSIYKKLPNGKTVTLLAFYLKNNSKDAEKSDSNAISYYSLQHNKLVSVNSLEGKNSEQKDDINKSLNYIIDGLTKDVVLNRSFAALTNKTKSNGSAIYFTRRNGKFVVTLGGKDLVYENYGDFVLKNRGFNTNVDGSKGFVKSIINQNKFNINYNVIDPNKKVEDNNTHVVDVIKDHINNNRKTIDTIELLEAAGVSKQQSDILLGVNSGMPIATKRITIDNKDVDDANMYYNNKDKTIHITPKGAFSMENNPKNTLRLVLHENIHRLFHNNRNLSNKERERIVEELREVYDYTIDKLKQDVNNGRISRELYDSITSVLDKAVSNESEATNMEEFMIETLTQKPIVNYLNHTNYKYEAVIDNIEEKNKTIFQKIIDILLDLLGIKDNKLNNNTILAREYQILSKGLNKTDSGIFNKPINNHNTISTPPAPKSGKKYIWTGKEGFVKHEVGDTIQDNINHKTYRVTKVSDKGAILELIDEEGNVTNSLPSVSHPVEETPSTTPKIDTTKSKTDKPKTDKKDKPFEEDKDTNINTELLNQTVAKIDEIDEVFSKRIKRSDNFAKDHTYYIDGKKADTSVTERVHGKQDLGNIGIPASLLGNTADEAARLYFENRGIIPGNLPNSSNQEFDKESLTNEISKIETYLDNKFGKNRYKVITREFPIGGIFTTNGKEQTVAGTMDMIVCTDEGDIYIYDFKTKRVGNKDGKLDEYTIAGYSKQVNIYRQLIEANFPELKGRIKIGGLIKFNVDYELPSSKIVYKEDESTPNQILVSDDGGKTYDTIQDSSIDYSLPFLLENSDNTFIPVKEEDFIDPIGPLPSGTVKVESTVDRELTDEVLDPDAFWAKTDIIEDDESLEYIDTMYVEGYDNIDNIANTFLAPNGKPSNLTPEQYRQVRSKKFKAWFGDWENDSKHSSKVLDENGEPLIVYHGTNAGKIDIFDPSKSDDNLSIFTAKHKIIAESYEENPEDIESYAYRSVKSEEEIADSIKFKKEFWDKSKKEKEEDDLLSILGIEPEHKYKQSNLHFDTIKEEIDGLDNNGNIKKGYKYSLRIEFDATFNKVPENNLIDLFKLTEEDINNINNGKEITKHYDDISEIGTTVVEKELLDKAEEVRNNTYTMPLYENIKNPLIINPKDIPYFYNWDEVPFEGKFYKTREIAKIANERGYDGVIFNNIIDDGGHTLGENFAATDSFEDYQGDRIVTIYRKDTSVFVAFKGNQLKSATNNNGEFSTEDDNIYKAATPMITSGEIYSGDIENSTGTNTYGVQSVNNMIDYINTFPLQYKAQINALIDSGELIYSCR